MKKKHLVLLLMLLFLLLGSGLLIYPVFSNWYMEKVQSEIQLDYNETIKNLDEEIISAALADAHAYNEALFEHSLDESIKPYEEQLNISGSGIMGYVEIPAIDVLLPIYHYCTDAVMEKGAGHMEQTSLPVGGENTHAVISAHSGMASAKMFSYLDKIQTGDLIYLHILGQTLTYEVFDTITVLPSDVEHIQIEPGKDLLTLVTCVPFGVNSHRLLVQSERL